MRSRSSLALAVLALLASALAVRADEDSSGGGGPAGGAFMSSYSNAIWGAPASQWARPARSGAWDPPTTATTRPRARARRR